MGRTQCLHGCLFESLSTHRSSQFELLTWLLSSSLSLYDCFHWRKRALSFIVLPTQNFRQQTECYILILKALDSTIPQVLCQERNGKWSLLKEQHKSFASLGLPLFLAVLHISFGSILLVFHQLHPCGIYICLVRLLMTAGYTYGRKSGHSHCVGTNTIIWKKTPYKWIFSLLLFWFPLNPTYSLPVHFSSLVNFTLTFFFQL